MKNIEEKLISCREWPAHFQNGVTDGAGSDIVQLQEGDTLGDVVQFCLSRVCLEKRISLVLTMAVEHRVPSGRGSSEITVLRYSGKSMKQFLSERLGTRSTLSFRILRDGTQLQSQNSLIFQTHLIMRSLKATF